MARQVLPIVGAVAGFVITGGNPAGAQFGFAIGSLVGNAVDPIEMQGRKLGDAPSQVAAEGGARAVVYGKGCIRATCIIERGGRRVIKQRDSSGGKGSGPTTVNERALWTFAIGLGEPVDAILRIWENEKLVYDVTPDSTIQEDTEQFATKFRFYDGSETQLPDPALEALHGVGDTPYYRGTAYLVFPQYDLTDFGETVPTYRVEVASAATSTLGAPALVSGFASPSLHQLIYSPDGDDFSIPSFPADGTEGLRLLSDGERYISWGTGNASWSDDNGFTWVPSLGSIGGSGGVRGGDWKNGIILISGGINGLYRSMDRGVSIQQVFSSPSLNNVAIGEEMAVGVYSPGPFTGQTNVYALSPMGAYVAPIPYEVDGMSFLNTQKAVATDGATFRVAGNRYVFPDTLGPMVCQLIGGELSEVSMSPAPSGEITCIVCAGSGAESIWVIGLDNGDIYRSTGSSGFTLAHNFGVPVNDITHNGSHFIAVGSNNLSPATIKVSPDGLSWSDRTNDLDDGAVSVASVSDGGGSASGNPVSLGSVISSIHLRSGHESSDYDVSQATDMIAGVTLEQTLTAAEAINSLTGAHFIDASDYDGKIHYIRRGSAVVLTLTEDDLVDEPEQSQRNNAIEYPRKVHFLGQRADLAYASSKSTSARYSDDAKVVGEVTIGSPETYDDPQAPAEVAVKLHKVLWTEAEGEREWVIPDKFLGLVPTDNVGLSYRGELVRCRILQVEDTPGQRKLRMIRDRQSAYTANLTEIPNPPPPTPPQSSVVAPTIMAFIDSSALTDSGDSLHYLVALSGANENWAGAVLQQQLAGNFQSIDSTTLNSIIGVLQNTVSDASPYYTDTTNTATVRLYTDDQLESVTDEQFLSNGGAFFLSWESSGEAHWEIMQFRDAVQDSNGDWVLSRFMRGRKNTETAEHPPGSMFVFIDTSILREPAQSSWIGTELTHRAVSNGQSPELAAPQTNEYNGNSQREWPVANLLLSRPDANSVSAEAIPRHRFGTSMNPIRSINWEGYRWSVTDGINAITRDGTSAVETFDTTGWGSPVSVTVAQLNRITGAGPSVSEDIV